VTEHDERITYEREMRDPDPRAVGAARSLNGVPVIACRILIGIRGISLSFVSAWMIDIAVMQRR
jgi:hypothetical protein